MDLKTLSVDQLRAERIKHLGYMEANRRGIECPMSLHKAAEIKDAINAELVARDVPIKVETRMSTEQSKRLAQSILAPEGGGQ